MSIFPLFILFFVFSNIYSLRKEKCIVLALEGGGTKGAYHAGVFQAMVELMKSDDVAYDVIAGASIGSLNGLLISSFEKGREKEASVKLTEIWKKITRTDVYYHWPYVSFIQGFFWQTSFLDNSPLLPFIEKHFKELNSTIKRKFSFGIAEAQTGKYIQIDERTPPNKIPYYIVAATSVPGLFPYLIENDKVYIDGGTVDNLNLKGAIERCREIVGDDDSLITIDTIMTNPYDVHPKKLSNARTLEVAERVKEMGQQSRDMWYLNDSMTAHPKINWRYLIIPKEKLPNFPLIGLSFDPENLRKAREIGYKDATEVIKKTSNNFKEIVQSSSQTIKRKRIIAQSQ